MQVFLQTFFKKYLIFINSLCTIEPCIGQAHEYSSSYPVTYKSDSVMTKDIEEL